jgi:hypothetical protein
MIGDPETTDKPESINEPPGSNVIPPESQEPQSDPPARKVENDDDHKRKSKK